MAYPLNLADNRLPICNESRLPITDILEIVDILVFYWYISGKITNFNPHSEPILGQSPIADDWYFIGPDLFQ